MSKSLEKEYKKYIQMETPDLWDRIEQELTKNEQNTEPKQQTGRQGIAQKKKNKRVRKWAAYGSLAAAVLLVVAAFPLLRDSSAKNVASSSDMCAVDAAADREKAEAEVNAVTDSESVFEEGTISETIDLTITQITVMDDGVTFYSGRTESGEMYTFTLAENVVSTEEESKLTGLQEDSSYCIELKKMGGEYEAVSVRKIKK